MNEFRVRASAYQQAKQLRQAVAETRDQEENEALLARASAIERRARGFGTLRGKNRHGQRGIGR